MVTSGVWAAGGKTSGLYTTRLLLCVSGAALSRTIRVIIGDYFSFAR